MPSLEDYSPEDIERVRRLLQTPKGEKELQKWIRDWVSAHLYMTDASQIIGEVGYQWLVDEVLTEQSTTSTTFTNLATVGPSLSGFPDGKYRAWWGFQVRESSGVDGNAECALSTSVGTSDSHIAAQRMIASTTRNAVYGRSFDGVDGPIFRGQSLGGTNSITMVYRRQAAAGVPNFSKRWLAIVKIGEL